MFTTLWIRTRDCKLIIQMYYKHIQTHFAVNDLFILPDMHVNAVIYRIRFQFRESRS